MIKTIGFVLESNPFEDRKAWSGTYFKLREAIEMAGFKVIWIPCSMDRKKEILLKLYYKLRYGRRTSISHTKACIKAMCKMVDLKLVRNCDALITQWCGFPHYLGVDIPCISLSDATYKLMENYYWFGVHPHIIEEANEMERLGILAARINIRASEWAAQSTINDYGADPKHTYVLEFGANVDERDIVPIIPYKQENDKLRVLFSGVDWHRKGATTAIETVEILNKRGVPAELVMVGIRKIPEEYMGHPHVRSLGFLNKNNPEEYRQYVTAIQQCHIMLLPTRAECAGIVFCEAAAFGLPSYTYLTGGIGSYVVDGVNGFTLPLSASSQDFADVIIDSITPEKQQDLHDGALRMYQERLSWKAWAKRFREIVDKEFA